MHPSRILTLLCLTVSLLSLSAATAPPAILINKNFEGASLGTIEKQGDTTFRCHVEGQYDEHGHNRQASWFYFRMENVQGREVTLTFTDYVGEYNDKPGACPMNADLRPVFSTDNQHWQHFDKLEWDDVKKEATLHLKTDANVVWIAHQAPYTHRRLLDLLGEINTNANVRVEVIGRTSQGRELHQVVITNPEIPDAQKKCVWLQARQHAWEAGTSYVMEGALRFLASDDPVASSLRDKVVFVFTPMVDPDGVVNGKVRFNSNGYDVNRHWDEVDLHNKVLLQRMPEIWYVKKAILGWADSGHRTDLMINLHNNETAEYVDTMADDEASQERMQRLFKRLVSDTQFDPVRKLGINYLPANTTNSLYRERKIPLILMELRIGPSKKLGHLPTLADRLRFGRELITAMAQAALE